MGRFYIILNSILFIQWFIILFHQGHSIGYVEYLIKIVQVFSNIISNYVCLIIYHGNINIADPL